MITNKFFILFLLSFLPSYAHAILFTGLGDLPGGAFASVAPSVSGDGTTVSGYSSDGFGRQDGGFRWTQSGGIVSLESSIGTVDSRAHGISASGEIVVGENRSVNQAFRWTNTDGMVQLGVLDGKDTSSANAVSAAGSTIVGRSSVNGAPIEVEAFRWTEAEGMVGLGDLSGGDYFSVANGVSGDGSVIVGQSKSSNYFEAFRWTESEGMVGLGRPDSDGSSIAYDVSENGTTITGWATLNGSVRAFIWNEDDGMVALDSFGGNADRGLGISID